MTEEKKIPVLDRQSGKVTFADQAPTKPPHAPATEIAEIGKASDVAAVPATPAPADGASLGSEGDDKAANLDAKAKLKGPSAKKKKAEIDTLEQFLSAAYLLKGRRVSLSSSVERRIGQQPKLDEETITRLSALVQADIHFAVPRQLLLVAREIQTFPSLRGAIREFVKRTMLGHPLFACPELVAAINNTDEKLVMDAALEILASRKVTAGPNPASKLTLKPAQIVELKTNAACCLIVWFQETRGLSLSDVTDLLYRSLWSPAANSLRDESEKVRGLTELRDIAAAGFACGDFKRIASEAARHADAAREALERLTIEMTVLRGQLRRQEEESGSQLAELRAEVQSTNERGERIKSEIEHQLTHLRDDLEAQRTRVLRRLKADASMLDDGLLALRRTPPKTNVMDDHAERVLDSLRQEIKKLETGD